MAGKGKVKAMHINSMPGGHIMRVEREPDGDENKVMDMGQSEESMHPDGSEGAQHISALMDAHNKIAKGGMKKSKMEMPKEAMGKAFGKGRY